MRGAQWERELGKGSGVESPDQNSNSISDF